MSIYLSTKMEIQHPANAAGEEKIEIHCQIMTYRWMGKLFLDIKKTSNSKKGQEDKETLKSGREVIVGMQDWKDNSDGP